jgi:hypothetical protein
LFAAASFGCETRDGFGWFPVQHRESPEQTMATDFDSC